MRGNCSDPDAAAALGLSAEAAAAMLPLKPRQCVVLVPDSLLVSNGRELWMDNLYLKLQRTPASAEFTFVAAGMSNDGIDSQAIAAAILYVTNVTLQGEFRGSAQGFALYTEASSVLLQDCALSDWSGGASPLRISREGMVNVVDTVFRNMRLAVELADVSFGGLVNFASASLANVTLMQGRIVSTSVNDYDTYTNTGPEYTPETDEAYDVDYVPVPIGERGVFGGEFRIEDQVMSDCIYLAAKEVQPGCPQASWQKIQAMRSRGGGFDDYAEDALADLFPNDLPGPDSPWLLAVQAALGPLPPAPAGWPPFDVTLPGEPVNRSAITMPLPVPPGTVVPPFERTPAAVQAAGREVAASQAAYTGISPGGDSGPPPAVLLVAVVVALLAAIAAVAAAYTAWTLRRLKKRGRGEGGLLARPRRPRLPSWMSGGLAAATASHASGVTPLVSDPGSRQHGSTETSSSGQLLRSGSMPRSVMNPDYEYALPTHIAQLMGGTILETEVEVAADSGEERSQGGKKGANGGGRGGGGEGGSTGPVRMIQLPSLAATQPSGVGSERGISLTEGSSGSGAGGLGAHSSNTAPLADARAMQALEDSLRARSEEPGSTIVVAPYDLTQSSRTVGSTLGAPSPMHTIGGTIGSSSTSDGPGAGAGTGAEVFGIRMGRMLDPRGDTARWAESTVQAPAVDVGQAATDVSGSGTRIRRLQRLLDAFGADDLFLGRYEMLGRQHRRRGGQAVVQFADGADDHCEYAIKFFLDYDSFLVEAALYAACFPHVRAAVSDEVIARADAAARSVDGGAAVPMSEVAARFLPHVEAVCDGSAGGLEDPRGRWLPPCIVMEKGESLHDWSDRAEPDLFTSLAVLSNVSKRLADMHDAGYVHRDLKPANIMWLPRANRWTVIDFGCVARAGEVAPLNFTLAYAPPEVAQAFVAGQRHITSHAALDAWSLGVIAFELLTGTTAFNLLTDGRRGVIARLLGGQPLPWEGELSATVQRHLGQFKGPILQLLQRDPSQRIGMRRFHIACSKLFAARTTVEA